MVLLLVIAGIVSFAFIEEGGWLVRQDGGGSDQRLRVVHAGAQGGRVNERLEG